MRFNICDCGLHFLYDLLCSMHPMTGTGERDSWFAEGSISLEGE